MPDPADRAVDLRHDAPLHELPMALASAHRELGVGGRLHLEVAGVALDELDGTDAPPLTAVVEAGGFAIQAASSTAVEAVAERALPDHVGAGMRLLCCGLNPSLHAADAGVGYVTPSNRFWPAMIAAGLTDRPRDVRHLLRSHGIGMTDLVKRPTPRAAELSRAEYRAGVDRLDQLCTWLQPRAVVLVGLTGSPAGRDPKAQVGWQPARLGPTRVYVMPSTSGLNSRVPVAELARHLATAAAG